MPAPLVSIVLPTYNRGAFLAEAIESVRAQTFADWELLIADDGSTDDSLDVVPADPRVRVIRLPHTGHLARVRQAALDAARGDYVGFLDSDDRWLPDKLARQLARFDDVPEAAWCFAPYDLIDEHDRPLALHGVQTTHHEGRMFEEIVGARAGIAMQTILVRRDAARAVGFDQAMPMGDDIDFMIRLSVAGAACREDAHVAEIRQHAGRTSDARYDHSLYTALAFWRYQRLTTDRPIRRACRRRARFLARFYLAHARASGQFRAGLAQAAAAWWARV